ncbi:hypothetical protein SRHO_G00313470 [Serrasalmus rhombeus]
MGNKGTGNEGQVKFRIYPAFLQPFSPFQQAEKLLECGFWAREQMKRNMEENRAERSETKEKERSKRLGLL